MRRSHIGLFLACSSLALFCASIADATTFALYRSTDEGRSWTKAGQGIPSELRIEALAGSRGLRFAGTERGIFRSENDGLSWSRPKNTPTEGLHVFDFAESSGRIYAATSRGVWVSADGGQTWIVSGLELARVRVLSLAVLAETLIAGTSLHGVFMRSEDGPWERVDIGLPAGAQVFELVAEQGQVFAALYARGIYRLDLATRRWKPAGEEFPLRLVKLDGVLYSGRNPCGVFSSADLGETWSNTSQGLSLRAPTWTMATTQSAVLIGTRGPSGLMRLDPRVRTWRPSDQGLPPGSEAVAFGVAHESILTAVAAHTAAPTPAEH